MTKTALMRCLRAPSNADTMSEGVLTSSRWASMPAIAVASWNSFQMARAAALLMFEIEPTRVRPGTISLISSACLLGRSISNELKPVRLPPGRARLRTTSRGSAIVLREKNVDFEFRHIEPDNRPDWFLAISPHKKVPVLRVDDRVSLFESNAIAEYLDETVLPRLHPEDPVERAMNRAWTDYVPTFAEVVTATAYADTEADYNKAAEEIQVPFERLEKALAKQGSGPYFNGAKYSLVDAAYAPFLQRYFFLDHIRPLGHIEKFPRLKAWSEALMARPSTHSFPPAEFEAMYRASVKRRNKWLSQFIDRPEVAAA